MNSQNMQDTEQFILECLNLSPFNGYSESSYLDYRPTNDQTQTFDLNNQDDQQQEEIANQALVINNEISQNQVNNNEMELETIRMKKKKGQYGKNAPKQLGNYLKKYIIKKKLTRIPQLANFANKKQKNQQANYTLQDWRDLLLADNEQQQCREQVLEYLTNWAYIDILLEYKQQQPEEMIELLDHLICGCHEPSKLICNRR